MEKTECPPQVRLVAQRTRADPESSLWQAPSVRTPLEKRTGPWDHPNQAQCGPNCRVRASRGAHWPQDPGREGDRPLFAEPHTASASQQPSAPVTWCAGDTGGPTTGRWRPGCQSCLGTATESDLLLPSVKKLNNPFPLSMVIFNVSKFPTH